MRDVEPDREADKTTVNGQTRSRRLAATPLDAEVDRHGRDRDEAMQRDDVNDEQGRPRGGVRSSEELLARYRRRPDPVLRNELIERHRRDVERIARALAARLPRSVDEQDLVHAGLWGLVQSIEKFRAELGAPFRPFMASRVRGAMLDELRNLDFLPRLYRQRARALDAASTRLRDRLGRAPSQPELAAEMGLREDLFRSDYARLAELRRQPVRALPNAVGDAATDTGPDRGDPLDRLPDEAMASPLDALDRQDLLAKIEQSLQPIEWTVLRLHYLEGLSGKEVAERLHLSAARICQIHLRVLSRLKVRFASLAT